MKKQTSIINFFGQPGAGKSTLAAGLFYKMKKNNELVELIQEYAKELVWKGLNPSAHTQEIEFIQNSREQNLIGQVDYIITDSPLALTNFYTNKFTSTKLQKYSRSSKELNFFVKRTKPYISVGRVQTEQECDQISTELEKFLKNLQIDYFSIDSFYCLDKLYNHVNTLKHSLQSRK